KQERVSQALEASVGYTELLHELDKAHQRGLNAIEQLRFLNERIQEKEDEMDELKGEQNIKESEERKLENEIVSINERLELEGLDEIRARIQNVQQTIADGESLRDEIRGKIPQHEAELNQIEEKLQQ